MTTYKEPAELKAICGGLEKLASTNDPEQSSGRADIVIKSLLKVINGKPVGLMSQEKQNTSV